MVRAAQEILRESSKLTEKNVRLCAEKQSESGRHTDPPCKSPVASSASQPSRSPLYGRDADITNGPINSLREDTHSPNVLEETVMPLPWKKAKKLGAKKKEIKRKILESSEGSDSDDDWLP
jgi:hypothetical protein